MTTEFEAEALVEYQDAAQYSEDRFGLGQQFVLAVQQAIASMEQNPERCQAIGDGFRIYRMKRFPYYIIFDQVNEPQAIQIYAVAHHKRQPDYWRKRIKN